MKTIKDQIREICTFYGDDGTSGFLLDEGRFTKIFTLLDEQTIKELGDAIEMSKQGWIEQGRKEQREEIAEMIKKTVKLRVSPVPKEYKLYEEGFLEALDEIITNLKNDR